MDARRLVIAALGAFGLLTAAQVWSQTGTSLVPKTQNNVSYIVGGVGKDEQELADALKRDGYNVHLVFAEQTGAYMADVRVRISDSKGNIVLDTVADGPMLVAKLPPGRYNIAAEARGQTRTASVDTSAGVKRITMHWPSTVDKQGYDLTNRSVVAS